MTQPPPTAEKPAPVTTHRVKRPIRRTPGMVLAFLALGATSTVAVLVLAAGLYIFQDAYQATHQTSARESADAFLAGMLNERNLDITANYMCDSAALRRRVSSTIRRIRRFGESRGGSAFITYRWELQLRNKSERRAAIAARIFAKTTVNNSSIDSPPEVWSLDMRDRSGWKVCGLSMP